MDEANPRAPSGVSKEEAYEAFLQERYAKVVAAIRLIARDQAEDIAQEAFARAYIHWPKLWPDGNPVGWVHRVAMNLSLSLRTRAAREVRAVARLGKRLVDAPPPDAFPELHEAVASLPPRQRAAVALFYVLDLSVDDCAAAMRCKSGTVKSLLFDARESLRRSLGEDYK